MSDEGARRAMAELVEDHLSRNGPDDVAIATLAYGVGVIGAVVEQLQAEQGNWAELLGKLNAGEAAIRGGLSLTKHPEGAGLARFAQRQMELAKLLASEIERLQSGEITLV